MFNNKYFIRRIKILFWSIIRLNVCILFIRVLLLHKEKSRAKFKFTQKKNVVSKIMSS